MAIPGLAAAASLSASSRTCLFFLGNCTDGSPASGVALVPGATGIGSSTQDIGSNSQQTFWEATATAVVDFGIFHGEATANLQTPVGGPGDFVSANADGETIETVTIHDPTGQHSAGSPGLEQFIFSLSGGSAIAVGQDGEADALFAVGVRFDGPGIFSSSATGEVHSSGTYPLLQQLKFIYDVPFTMTTDYRVAASVQIDSFPPFFDATAGAFFLNTAVLSDIQTLDFATGDPVPGTVLTSDSDVQYPLTLPETAAPEPGTVLFAAGALLAFSVRHRLRRR
jgi:hypothetical protein